jgi:organic hydroperoxide reductase OsmC/OhrA
MPAFDISIPVRITPGTKSLDRQAELPPDGLVLDYGMHGDVADHYGAKAVNPLPSTLDYLTSSIAGCLIGTFTGSMLRAKIPVTPDKVTGTAIGSVVPDDDNVLRLRKVTVNYRVELDEEHREAAEEVHAMHAGRCPNARSVSPSIEIETNLELLQPTAA